MAERPIDFRGIRIIRQESFQRQRQSQTYIVSRGLFGRRQGLEYIQGYNDCLPKFEGKHVRSLIEEAIDQRGQATILDIGCGEGRFMADCVRTWGDRVRCLGVTAFPYGTAETLNRLSQDPRIQVEYGDAQSLGKLVGRAEFDIAVAAYVADYLADPFAMLKGMHKALRVGGIGLSNHFYIRSSKTDEKKIVKALEAGNVHLRKPASERVYSLSFQKQGETLALPVSYQSSTFPVFEFRDNALVFSFNQRAATK